MNPQNLSDLKYTYSSICIITYPPKKNSYPVSEIPVFPTTCISQISCPDIWRWYYEPDCVVTSGCLASLPFLHPDPPNPPKLPQSPSSPIKFPKSSQLVLPKNMIPYLCYLLSIYN